MLIVKIKNRIELIRIKKHIALFLFGIFFYSILFPALHIVWHHKHGYKKELHYCHQESSEEESQAHRASVSEKESPCSICEYQISIGDVSEIPFFSSIIPVFYISYIGRVAEQQFCFVFSIKTPRAPPILNSYS